MEADHAGGCFGRAYSARLQVSQSCSKVLRHHAQASRALAWRFRYTGWIGSLSISELKGSRVAGSCADRFGVAIGWWDMHEGKGLASSLGGPKLQPKRFPGRLAGPCIQRSS